jgi:hypothetical protein
MKNIFAFIALLFVLLYLSPAQGFAEETTQSGSTEEDSSDNED